MAIVGSWVNYRLHLACKRLNYDHDMTQKRNSFLPGAMHQLWRGHWAFKPRSFPAKLDL